MFFSKSFFHKIIFFKLKSRKYFMLLPAVIFIQACEKENMCDCFKGTGGTTTEIRNLSGFSKIELNNNVDLVVRPEVHDQTLEIRNKNKCNWVRSFKNKYTVEVSMPSFTYLYYSGSGTITTLDTIRENEFKMDGWTCSGSVNLLLHCGTSWLTIHTGTADLTASGISGVNYIYSAGAGPYNCTSLETGYTFITNQSTNDCYIYVTQELQAKLNLQGNIYYRGEPHKVEKELNGTGELIHVN
jgi:hypothetical protein